VRAAEHTKREEVEWWLIRVLMLDRFRRFPYPVQISKHDTEGRVAEKQALGASREVQRLGVNVRISSTQSPTGSGRPIGRMEAPPP
jgi:hypothetical protein